MLSDSQLQQIMPTLSASKREMYLPFLNAIMPMYDINTPLREAAFLAQIAHESGELKFWEEIWGPTAAQKRYEPPSDLATRLGNTQPGDGKRYKGRGPIQVTGRANYRKYGQLLGVDLEGNPDLAATTQIGLQVAGQFWQTNGLNQLADIPDFITITKRINGGLNGLASRQKYYEKAKQVLGVNASFGALAARSVSRGGATQAKAAVANKAIPDATLPRGQEAIEEVIGASASGSPTKAPAKKKSAPKPAQPANRAAKKVAAKNTAKKASQKSAPAVKAGGKQAAKKAAQKSVKKPTAPLAAKKIAKKAAKKTAKKATKK